MLFTFTWVVEEIKIKHQDLNLRFAILAMATLLLLCQPAVAAQTGVKELDQAAIGVKAPGNVMLDAIARAGNRLVAAGEHGVIAYSDDNGVIWHQASVPVGVTLTAVAFATPMQGWAAGNSGVILHSEDGGISWREQLNGFQTGQLTQAAANAVSPSDTRFAGAANARRRANIFVGDGPDMPFLSVLPLSATQLFAFGAYRMTMYSNTGGSRWLDWSLRIGDPVSHHLYDAAFVGSEIFVVGEAGLVFRSGDAGNSFPAVTPAGSATLFGVTGTGDGVLVFGVAGLVYKSVDDGKRWTQIPLASDANLMGAITLPSGAILLAAESGNLFISVDHGNSFKALPVALPMALYAMAQAADGDLIAVGNRGAMAIPAASLGLN